MGLYMQLKNLMRQSRDAPGTRSLSEDTYTRVGVAALLLDQLLDVLRGEVVYYAGRDPSDRLAGMSRDTEHCRDVKIRQPDNISLYAWIEATMPILVDAVLGLDSLLSDLHLFRGALRMRKHSTADVLCSIDKLGRLRSTLTTHAVLPLKALNTMHKAAGLLAGSTSA